MIKNYVNFDNSTGEDFWLHRYSSAEYLEKTFNNSKFNLHFTTALDFKDSHEGWGIENRELKDKIDIAVKYFNRVTGDKGNLEALSAHLAKTLNQNPDELIKTIQQFENYNNLRKFTYISCWFKTDTLEEENRAMWNLYGNNENGIRISMKWSNLQDQLNKRREIFDVGFIDYGNENKLENLFFVKDKSYKHENEFRLTLNNENSEKEITIPLDLVKIYSIVRSQTIRDEIMERLSRLGFENDENAKWMKKESHLSYEMSQVDWSLVLNHIKNELN